MIGFVSGALPYMADATYSVSCVPSGEPCEYPPSGDGAATGSIPEKNSPVEVTIDGLESGSSYSCFASAFRGKVRKCVSVTPDPVSISQFYRSRANGVTIFCPNAAPGDTGIVDGVMYTARNESDLRQLASNVTSWDLLTTSCTSGVQDLSFLFDNSRIPGFFYDFNVDISTWDTSNVVNMESLFFGASAFNQSIELWDTSSVENMDSMFEGAAAFDGSIGDWDTSNVQSMSAMFRGAVTFNQEIRNWDTRSVELMDSMFERAVSFNQLIDIWDTQSLKDMDSMFKNASVFNLPIGDWDTSSVEDMESVFYGATSFNQSIGDWDTSNVIDMHGMFAGATAFNQPIPDWDTSNVEFMDTMFKAATAFNQYIGDWNTSAVVDMDSMFHDAVAFNQNLSTWEVAQVVSCVFFSEGAASWTNSALKPALTCPQGACFPADAIVYTHDRGAMEIQHVRIGDRLLSYSVHGEAFYDPVYMLGHKDPSTRATFISITARNNQTVRLTPDHYMVIVRHGKTFDIPSQHVKVGDGMIVGPGRVETVMTVSTVSSKGMYNPYTMSGRIVVDGVLASCHSSSLFDRVFNLFGIPLSTGYQVVFAPIRLIYRVLGPQIYSGMFERIIDGVAHGINNRAYQNLDSIWQTVALTSSGLVITLGGSIIGFAFKEKI